MTDLRRDLGQLETSFAAVIADVGRARSIVSDAMHRLFESFDILRQHLTEERARYEHAVKAITGSAAEQGLVGVIREVLGKFVSDIERISGASSRILTEVDALRGHANQVASRGLRIEKIAQTTRVISLNARIEAQRVGSAGAVFRVVADEIKGLANESGELSKAIRHAITQQAVSLRETSQSASELASTDLNLAVDSHGRLESTIAKLSQVSQASTEALERIQRDVDAAIQALQFEDMLDQLLAAIANKLTAMRTACGAMACGEGVDDTMQELARQVKRDAVTQHDVSGGSVELF